MNRKRPPFPGVTRVTDRHGKVRWRLRKGGADAYLPGPYGSPAFRAAYEAALNGARAARPAALRAQPGTLDWLIEHFTRSPRYANLSDARRKSLRGVLDWLRAQAGDLPFASLRVRHVEALMARKTGPAAANTVRKTLSQVFAYAVHAELTTVNPARAATRRKVDGQGFHTWTEGEITQFLACHGPGTKARLALMLMLYTGAARQDVARMGWQNVTGGAITYRRGKTGIAATLPIGTELAEELRHVPADRLLFLTHGEGRPYTAATFGGWFKARCIEAGLPHCAAHGLRKAAATRIADRGGSEHEVMAFMGHASPAEGATYTRRANKTRLAASAAAKAFGANPEQTLSNLSERLDKPATQAIERKGEKP